MIDVQDLVMKYGDEVVLKNLSFTVEENTTCAIIGPSGGGKSTLLYGIAGLLHPFSGKIYVGGQKVVNNRQETALILQNHGLFPWKTVWENAALGLKIRGVHKETITKKVTAILKRLEVLDLKDKYPIQLSGGQRQRVAIARALAIAPNLLLMDEPFSSLDAITRESLQTLVLELYQETTMTTVLVTHNIEEAVLLGKKIVVMDQKSIKHVLENPLFGDASLRDRSDFFEMCQKVRRLLEERNSYSC